MKLIRGLRRLDLCLLRWMSYWLREWGWQKGNLLLDRETLRGLGLGKHLFFLTHDSRMRTTEPLRGNRTIGEQGVRTNLAAPLALSRPQKEDLRHLCNRCTKSFTRKGDLKRHFKSHFESQRVFHCYEDGCSKNGPLNGFYRRDKYKEHQFIAHGISRM
jgi:hypothetical protein